MVFESLDEYFSCITVMNMWGNKLVRDIFLKEGLLEDITSIIVHDMELGRVTSRCEYVQEFWYTFLGACA